MEEKYYTLKEVADLLKVTYMTVFRWVRAKKIPFYKIEKQYRIDKKDFENFMQSYKVNKHK